MPLVEHELGDVAAVRPDADRLLVAPILHVVPAALARRLEGYVAAARFRSYMRSACSASRRTLSIYSRSYALGVVSQR
ncbi:hypothetical protein ACFYYP_07540 [Microbispora rosea]|uniref:hypothetical protein n=1 Tax=Microbispora rosea TaxID=58117 RepID=UPI00369B89F1